MPRLRWNSKGGSDHNNKDDNGDEDSLNLSPWSSSPPAAARSGMAGNSSDDISRISSRVSSMGSDASMANMLNNINLSDSMANRRLDFESMPQTRKRRLSSPLPIYEGSSSDRRKVVVAVRPTARRATALTAAPTKLRSTDDIAMQVRQSSQSPGRKRQRTQSIGGGKSRRRRVIT